LISIYLPGGINSGVVADAWVDDDLAVCVSHTLGLSDVDWQCMVVAVALRGRVDGRVIDFEWTVEFRALLLFNNRARVVAAGIDRFFFGGVFERLVIGRAVPRVRMRLSGGIAFATAIAVIRVTT
jgi:hypothetical protein